MERSVSVVIPAYNAERYIGASIASVLDQTFMPVECIVVDDASDDSTAEVVRSFGPPVIYVHQARGGVSAARNNGVAHATGDLVAFLDADDVWLPKKLALQIRAFDMHPGSGMVYTSLHVVDQDLRFLGKEDAAPDGSALRNTLLLERPIMTGLGSSALVPRAVLRSVGGFDERLSTSADCDLGCRVALEHQVTSVGRPLVLYRTHPGQMHKDPDLVARDMLVVYDKLFKDPRLPADVRHLRGRAVGNLLVSVAGAHLLNGDKRGFLRYAVKAFLRRPDRVLAALRRLSRPGAGMNRAA